MAPPDPVYDELVNEFVNLNRRRLFGGPPLVVEELERWQWLRQTLEQHFGGRLRGILETVERRAHFRFPTHLNWSRST